MGQADSKQEMFWDACGYGRAHLVQKFIEHGIDVNCVSSVRGNTAVHHAAIQGHADMIQMLLDAGADINAQDKNGWTPLHCAAYYAHLTTVEVLLGIKCDINILNKDGRSALVETARSKSDVDESLLGEIAGHLIRAGCDVDLKCADLGEASFTALMFASYHNHVDVARALIEGGCDLNSASCYTKWTALHWAADRGHAEMVKLLLDAGADPTRMGTRGELAASRAQDEAVRELLGEVAEAWREAGEVEKPSLSCAHVLNAQASLDTARALESLSCHAKNRDILSTSMPSIPALGISSRSDPKTRYTKRSVTEVATKNLHSVFPWKSYSKQGSPSPDKDGVTRDEGNDLERRKMFPAHDEKANAFMDSLAQRINYITSRIATMSSTVVDQGAPTDQDESSQPSCHGAESSQPSCHGAESSQPSCHGADNSVDCHRSHQAVNILTSDDSLEDSGLSTLANSECTSELATPDDGITNLVEDLSQTRSKCAELRSPKPSSCGPPSKPVRLPKNDVLDIEADACIIEASQRGLSILHALQERHRHSMFLAAETQAGDVVLLKP